VLWYNCTSSLYRVKTKCTYTLFKYVTKYIDKETAEAFTSFCAFTFHIPLTSFYASIHRIPFISFYASTIHIPITSIYSSTHHIPFTTFYASTFHIPFTSFHASTHCIPKHLKKQENIFNADFKFHELTQVGGVNNYKYVCLRYLGCFCGLISQSYESFYGFTFVDWFRL
jgi:hypothetical protein